MRCVYYIVSLLSVSQSGETRLAVAPVKHWSLHTLRERARETIPDTLKKIEDTRGARRGRALRSLTLCRVLSKLPVSGSPAAPAAPRSVCDCAQLCALYGTPVCSHHADHRHRACTGGVGSEHRV